MSTTFETIDRAVLDTSVGGYTEQPIPPPTQPKKRKGPIDGSIDPEGERRPPNENMDREIDNKTWNPFPDPNQRRRV